MEKANINLEILFESQKKSFVILSKNKISFDDIKQKTIKEFNIPKEFEKDMRFTISINNRQITLINDIQISKNLEEVSKNNYYLKIFFNVNNKNYKYTSSKKVFIKTNKKIKPYKVNNFYIISKNKKLLSSDENKTNDKYEDEIKKLREEISKLKNEKITKGEIDIRKFDEKYRDLNNKNNILEQKITELVNENKTLKIKKSKRKFETDLSSENTSDNDFLIKEIKQHVSKLLGEHETNIIKEISQLKDTVDLILKEQKALSDKINITNFKNIEDNNEITPKEEENINDIKKDKNDVINDKKNINEKEIKKDNIIKDFNILNDDKNTDNNIQNEIDNNNQNEIDKNNQNEIDNNNQNEIDINNEEKIDKNNSNNNVDENDFNNDDKNDNNFENLDHLAEILNDVNETNKNFKSVNLDIKKDEENKEVIIDSINKSIDRIINYYNNEEDEKNSKSSITLDNNVGKPKDIIKDLKNKFYNNINSSQNLLKKESKTKKLSKKYYTKYTAPHRKTLSNRIKNQKHIFNGSKPELYDDLMNYDSYSEINTEFKKPKYNKMATSNSQKSFLIKIEKRSNKYLFNTNTSINKKNKTSYGSYTTERSKRNRFRSNDIVFTPTPNHKIVTVKENIENYFITIFQHIFFYGNNCYINMLKISDKLINKLKEGLRLYRLNLNEIKDVCIKYISFSILPIVNDINTKEYQRKVIKTKIKIVSEILRVEKNYFNKYYKEIKDDKKEKSSDDSYNDVNITHAKINEFRNNYDLKEKDYPDELIIKALIRYRGNKELAFQYLFY